MKAPMTFDQPLDLTVATWLRTDRGAEDYHNGSRPWDKTARRIYNSWVRARFRAATTEGNTATPAHEWLKYAETTSKRVRREDKPMSFAEAKAKTARDFSQRTRVLKVEGKTREAAGD